MDVIKIDRRREYDPARDSQWRPKPRPTDEHYDDEK